MTTALERLAAVRPAQPQLSSLEKLVALSGEGQQDGDYRAEEVVLSALADLYDVQVLLADSSSDDDSSSSSSDDDEDKGEDQLDAMVAKLVNKGIPKARAIQMAKQAMKRVKASAQIESAILALSKLSLPPSLDGGTLQLSVLTAEERRKPSAHTISGSEDYPIPDKGHLQAAIARYKEGKLAGHSKDEVRKHILSSARRLGVEVDLVAE